LNIVQEEANSTEVMVEDGKHADRLHEPAKRLLSSDYPDSQRVKPEFGYMVHLDSLLRNYKAEQSPEKPANNVKLPFFSSTFFKILLWGLAIFAVLYLLYNLLIGQGNLFYKNKKLIPDAATHEEHPAIISPLQLSQQAEARGDYRQAVRYLYAYLLQLLGEKQHVVVLPQKTSQHYIKEVAARAYYTEFAKLTLQYEYVWFGGIAPNKTQYDIIREGYRNFLSKWL
jgi:hypothetical protein